MFSASVFEMNTLFLPIVLDDIVQEYSTPTHEWIAHLLKQKDSSNRIATYCLELLRQNLPNGIQNAFNLIPEEQKKTLLDQWEQSPNETLHFLRAYFLPLKQWGTKEALLLKNTTPDESKSNKNLHFVLSVKNSIFKKELLNNLLSSVINEKKPLLHLNFSGAYISDRFIDDIAINEINFSHAILRKITFSRSQLNDAVFTQSHILNGQFFQAQLVHANFNRTHISISSFEEANLSGATFCNATIASVNFSYADLGDTNFSGANITNIVLEGARLAGCNMCYMKSVLAESQKVLIKRYIREFTEDTRFNPLINYLSNYASSNAHVSVFAPRPPFDQYLATLWLLGCNSKEELQARIKKLPPSVWFFESGNKFKLAVDSVLNNFSAECEGKFEVRKIKPSRILAVPLFV